eukprot:CAMPEP_0117583018 /NCGR_PEP_ID=MMETSP0784-20121206/66763_1 /TAXON_ID=39447 /ORGANISM="" /LENGTH=340 /DNA_ID=CAMNT_0005383621 /DNA_START=72 /DNA_END=1094 /DNA_ORIENTATION=-
MVVMRPPGDAGPAATPAVTAAAAAAAGRHEGRRARSGARGRRSCCVMPGQIPSKSPIRSISGPRSTSSSRQGPRCVATGSLGCILPGQVLSPSPPRNRRSSSTGAFCAGGPARNRPYKSNSGFIVEAKGKFGLEGEEDGLWNVSPRINEFSHFPEFAGVIDATCGACDRPPAAAPDSAACAIGEPPGDSHVVTASCMAAESSASSPSLPASSVLRVAPPLAPAIGSEAVPVTVELVQEPRTCFGRRIGRGRKGKEPIPGDPARSGPMSSAASDVDRLIARCMTHERPAALVQAPAALLDACAAKLGEQAKEGEKRNDKLRRMLRLTDELRRYNAALTENS